MKDCLMNKSVINLAVLLVSLFVCCSLAIPAHATCTTDAIGGTRSYTNMQPSLGLNYMVNLQGLFPPRNLTDGEPNSGELASSDPYIGSVSIFGGSFAPRGWAAADGQLLAINSNQSLFAILGDTYGGDGRTTFALPDLRGRVPIHSGATGPGIAKL